ncbi:hypothetical protein Tco_1323744, partial [Tanacetum coccineum]
MCVLTQCYSRENTTLKKRLDETETKLAWARMERDIAERSLHESRVWNKRFYLDMVRIGAVPKPPSDEEDTERPRKKSKNSTSDGTEGPSEPRGPPIQVKTASGKVNAAGADGAGAGGAGVGGVGPAAPEITSDCKEKNKVKFATATLQGRALTWWDGRIAYIGIDAANSTPWTEVRKWITEEFCPQSVLQRLEMVEPEQVRVEQYIHGLSKNIRDKTDEASEGEKRKGEGDRGGRGDNRRDYNRQQNQRRANARAMTNDAPNDNKVCPKSKNK